MELETRVQPWSRIEFFSFNYNTLLLYFVIQESSTKKKVMAKYYLELFLVNAKFNPYKTKFRKPLNTKETCLKQNLVFHVNTDIGLSLYPCTFNFT